MTYGFMFQFELTSRTNVVVEKERALISFYTAMWVCVEKRFVHPVRYIWNYFIVV